MTRETRPELNEITSAQEFRRWYWLKEELVAYCKHKGISTVDSKLEIADRIAEYLETGQIVKRTPRQPKSSRFNWAKATLGLETVITDNVAFGKNFRGFMKAQIGSKFVCHSDFMD